MTLDELWDRERLENVAYGLVTVVAGYEIGRDDLARVILAEYDAISDRIQQLKAQGYQGYCGDWADQEVSEIFDRLRGKLAMTTGEESGK